MTDVSVYKSDSKMDRVRYLIKKSGQPSIRKSQGSEDLIYEFPGHQNKRLL